MTAVETNLAIMMQERPKTQQDLIELDKTVVENEQDIETLQEDVEKINKHFTMFIGALGSLILTLISVAATLFFR